jgi:hypothetical protein
MISELVQGVLRKAIRRFAKKSGKTTDEVQLMISWNSQEEMPTYKKLVEGVPNEPISFLDVMNIPADIFGQGRLVADFITKRFEEYSEEYGCDKSELFLVIMLSETEESETLRAFLYRGNQEIKEVNLEQFFA